MNLILFFGVTVFVVALDLITKFLVKGSEVLMRGDVIDIIPGVFRFRYVENAGAAMGSFASNRWVFMVFSTVAILAIAFYLVKYRQSVSRLFGISMAAIMGGGIGNMYERLFNQNAQGQYVVTDFFDFYLFSFWKWVFNVADVAVCVGAALVVLCLIIELVGEYRSHKKGEEQDELVALDAIGEDEDDLRELSLLDGDEEDREENEQTKESEL